MFCTQNKKTILHAATIASTNVDISLNILKILIKQLLPNITETFMREILVILLLQYYAEIPIQCAWSGARKAGVDGTLVKAIA